LPNRSHDTLASLQSASVISNIITQNVDGLHTKSGASPVLEIHGSLHEVECQACRHVTTRLAMQERLAKSNPAFAKWLELNPTADSGDVASSVNPDGDVEISWNYDDFVYPSCTQCGGILKPR